MAETTGTGPAPERKDLSNKLEPFLKSNPGSGLSRRGTENVISCPWGDPTLEIVIPPGDADPLIEALNAVYLPPQYSAVWHKDSKDLEFIFSAIATNSPLRERAFDFRFGTSTYRCEYAVASTRLLAVARYSHPTTPLSPTEHRNLPGLYMYQHYEKEHPETGFAKDIIPTSFWIHVVDWDESIVLELARNLNFYMYYFHRSTPRILIHEEQPTSTTSTPLVRYPFGPFPNTISGRPLDPYLLGLWQSSVTADPFLRFLYNYQILEYSAFYYVQDGIRRKLENILRSPEMPLRAAEAVHAILDIVSEARQDDEAKFAAAIKQLVNPEALWKEIAQNMDSFSSDTKFDGGFEVSALLKNGWALDDFKAAWIPKFPEALRKIRNALVHAREARMSKVIAPTASNYSKLRPWTTLISVAAMHTMLHQ